MIIGYDRNPNASTDQKVQSLMESVQMALNETSVAALSDALYPIGSYYETSDTSFNPNASWSGTWELDSANKWHRIA